VVDLSDYFDRIEKAVYPERLRQWWAAMVPEGGNRRQRHGRIDT
jgi:hypothetical protein